MDNQIEQAHARMKGDVLRYSQDIRYPSLLHVACKLAIEDEITFKDKLDAKCATSAFTLVLFVCISFTVNCEVTMSIV